ncbi:MAG: 4-hydroxybenzoyl-CoA reductase subunit gamma [Deltaproteobacteria bacterium]|nr:MAG: 4-hydroxybenzoyl-CoA reductase subunit gamma [Deltaproteobacteria bacterium]
MKVQLVLNGKRTTVDMPPLMRLIDALRGPLGLTGTKEGCGEGECGSCTVLLDGEPVNACLIAIWQCEGRTVVTVEGLGAEDRLSPVQQCLADHGGAQCGICSPGVLISAEALLRRTSYPTTKQIRDAISGNLCRCTGYERIVQSVAEAAKKHREADETGWGAEETARKGGSL